MLLLLSGGLDSALCLEEFPYSECLTFDYGQRHRIEIEYAAELTHRYRVDHSIIKLPIFSGSALCGDKAMPHGLPRGPDTTYVPGRNVVFLSIACSIAESRKHEGVIIGSNADDARAYPDCRADFFIEFEKALRKGMVNPPQILRPNILRTKKEIVQKYQKARQDINKTWSCYNPIDGRECMKCGACVLRKEAWQSVNN